MYEVYVYPSDGVNPTSIAWTSGDTENNYDEFAIYDGVGDDAISFDNLITEIEDNLPFNMFLVQEMVLQGMVFRRFC